MAKTKSKIVLYPCKHCISEFHRLADYRRHMRVHKSKLPDSPAKPPNALLSRKSDGKGVFDFDDVLLRESNDQHEFTQASICSNAKHSDVDSFYSDAELDNMSYGNNNDDVDDENPDDGTVSDNNYSDDDSDLSDDTYVASDISHVDDNDDCLIYDFDDDALSSSDDEDNIPNYTPRPFPDEHVPFSENIYKRKSVKQSPRTIAQLQISQLFNRNKASIAMHDELIDIINAYVESVNPSPTNKLLHRQQFLDKMEKSFSTSDLKPTYGSVRLTNNTMVTVPIFDIKAMILSIVHDELLMREENFAPGLDIFTGAVDRGYEGNLNYGEFHTGDRWEPAVKRIVGTSRKYMPFGMVVFGDKSHTDQHGTLSLTPVTFTATFFNRAVRNNPDSWRPMGYIPNLSHANVGGTNSSTKSQSEHHCIAYVLKPLIELSEQGGIKTEVMGKKVHIKPFIHVFIGDTEGHNKWLGHYNSSQPGVSRPYRDCHCTYNDLSHPNPACEYTKAIEFRRALRMNAKEGNEKVAKRYFKLQSRHNINNALYQARLPLSDGEYGANRMCPPELLHTLDAGLTIYILESLQDLIRGGSCRDELDFEHRRMYRSLKRQSERDLPRGAIRSGLVESTRCQSSERKGNLFILLCIAHTSVGEMILRTELNLNRIEWQHWLLFLQMYLSMEEWFHDSRPKEEVRDARDAISAVIQSLKKFFPRKNDSNGYNIPKLHGLTKVQYYMCLFGSAINFYGGPGEASHKLFVKAPGARTQKRVGEFATQTADQYYAIMVVNRVTRFVDVRLPKEKLKSDSDVDDMESSRALGMESSKATGRYLVYIHPDGRNVVQSDSKQLTDVGIDDNLLRVFRRLAMGHEEWDGRSTVEIIGFTHANVVGNDGELFSYNAHPCYHGAPWYDWAHVHYAVEQADGSIKQQYYPSRIMGFLKTTNGIEAIIQYSIEEVTWEQLENNFVVPFHLCTERGKEDVVPLSSLCNPICVIPDYGNVDEDNRYMMILPKGHWSGVFTRFIGIK